MRICTLMISMTLALGVAACDKKKDDGDGGGGGWLVTDDGTRVFVPTYGEEIGDYDITTRGDDVFVVADGGLVLRTLDAGVTWHALELDTTRDLRGVAAAPDHVVYVVGDELAMMSTDDGDHWSVIEGGDRAWAGVTAIDGGALLAADDGSSWRYAEGALTRLVTN